MDREIIGHGQAAARFAPRAEGLAATSGAFDAGSGST
jgi:hypothetical protein